MTAGHAPSAGTQANATVSSSLFSSAFTWLLGVACLAAMVASGLHLWPQARANALAMEPLAQVRQWQANRAKSPSTAQWLQTRAMLARAMARSPNNAELQEAMAYLYIHAALKPGQLVGVQQPYLQQALVHLEVAIRGRPMVPSAWQTKALALHRLALLEPGKAATLEAPLWQALDKALAYGARDNGVQLSLGSVVFSRWAELGQSRQQAVRGMLEQATTRQRQKLDAHASHYQVVTR